MPSPPTFLLLLGFVAACTAAPEASAQPAKQPQSTENKAISSDTRSRPAPEVTLGVADQGIFADLDAKLQLRLPAEIDSHSASGHILRHRKLLVLSQDGWPVKVYPLDGPKVLLVGSVELALRPGDREELAPLLRAENLSELGAGSPLPWKDRDGDGIPDALDVLVGAHKTVLNGASYGGGYRRISYPNGDIPREDGVCTDVVVRAVRNAGLDIQSAMHRDIKRAPKAFPMVKKPNPHIDHRRVKTMLPYFKRHWEAHAVDTDVADDPYRPGDIIFMDTFPRRKGPDHIGVVSNTRGPRGHYLVVNNWTDGFQTSEMDLIGVIPVTHRFRLR